MERNAYNVPYIGVTVSAIPGCLAYLSVGQVTSNSVTPNFVISLTLDL
jgi:hypothetical protein